MLKSVGESMKEENGQFSSTRFSLYATLIVILGTYVAHNVVALVKSGDFVDFPLNTVGVLGILLTGKVIQKFAEKKKSS